MPSFSITWTAAITARILAMTVSCFLWGWLGEVAGIEIQR
jgi:hypothetical protein